MKKEMLNGDMIPYDLSVGELEVMMTSAVMKDFTLACEALSYKNDPEAYRIMRSYINDKDKYRRIYILKTIFRHREAVELSDFIENSISSEDFLFVENGLTVISSYNIKVSDTLLLSAVRRHLPKLYTGIRSLKMLDVSDEHYTELVKLFKRAKECAQKEFIAEILTEKYLPEKAKELFEVFSCDKFGKIRIYAVNLAKIYGYDLTKFLSDTDGHVKKLAEKFV